MTTPLDTTLDTLTGNTVASVQKLWAAYSRGVIDLVTFQTGMAAVVTAANATGGAVGTLALAANLSSMTGLVVAPEPVSAPAHLLNPGRVEKATQTILGGSGDPEMRLTRIASTEPIEAAQGAMGAGIARSKLLQGWERDLEVDACQLCTWWARLDDVGSPRIWPKEHAMPTHKGCRCTQRPVLTDEIQQTVAQRNKEREERAIANRNRSSSTVRRLMEEGKL